LKNITGLLVDRDASTRGLIAQTQRAFGIKNPMTASAGEFAKQFIPATPPSANDDECLSSETS